MGIVLGIIGGLIINSYLLAQPHILQSNFVYVAKAEEPRVVQIATDITWTEERLDVEIREQAHKYGVKPDVMRAVIKCESSDKNGVPSSTIQSNHRHADGTREDSWGFAQIHLPSHPEITRKQAIDGEFAIAFMAREMSEGNAWKWTCWRNLYQ